MMEKGFTLGRSIDALVQETKKLLHNNSSYKKAIEIHESVSKYYRKCSEAGEYTDIEMLQHSYLQVIRLLVTVLDTKDNYTGRHCRRVTKIAVSIGRALGFSKEELMQLEFAGLLHDIGKVAIPSEIINKEGRLTEQEFEIVKLHPLIGYQLIEDIEFLAPSNRIFLQHHERIDGKGYPFGLKGNQIDIMAKVLSVADAYDAMRSSRPYRKAKMTKKEAVSEIERYKGSQFDHIVTQVFLDLVESGEVA